jgi:methionine sulfoxide reductase heme-binding subunit
LSIAAPARKRAARSAALLKPAVFALCLVPAAWLLWNVYLVVSGARGTELTGLGANPVTELEIQTGLWAMRFLAITLAVTPVREVSGLGALAKYRRMLGLFTFFYACLHISMWLAVDWFFDWAAMADEVVKHKYIFVGMATFLTLVPLAITSTKGWIRRLGGRRWNRLHRLVYVAAIGATVHYLWAVKKDTLFPAVYFLVFALLLGYRAQRALSARRARRLREAT